MLHFEFAFALLFCCIFVCYLFCDINYFYQLSHVLCFLDAPFLFSFFLLYIIYTLNTQHTQPIWVGHSFFGTVMFVMMPSYYFCYRRREHHEQVIESMMQYNQFGHAKTDLPPEPPLEEHPFWEQQDYADQYNPDDPTTATTTPTPTKHDREFRGMIKEQKEWQKKANPSMKDIFQEKK